MSFAVPSIKAVLFDLDGTLLDSAPDLAVAANQVRINRGLLELPLTDYRAHAGSGARGMLHVALGMAPEHPDYETTKAEFLVAYQTVLLHAQAFDGVALMVSRLQFAGLPWGIVTNKAERLALPLIATKVELALAAVVVCGDTTAHAKPHPEPLFEAARRLALSPADCVYVGDDERDIVAGRAAGMPTVAALYGYLGPQARPETWGANASIQEPMDLLGLLAVR